MRALRNFLIIAAIAFVLAEGPAGGHVADGVLGLITVAFAGLIGFAILTAYRENRLSFDAMTENQRRTIVVALGGIALMIAGSNKLLDSGGGTLLWLLVIGACLVAMVRTVIDSRTL